MRSKPSFIALGLITLSLGAKHTLSATRSASFSVSVTATASCQVASNPMTFATYAAAATNAQRAISVICSQPIPYSLDVSAARSTRATVNTQQIIGQDPARAGYVVSSVAGNVFSRSLSESTKNAPSQTMWLRNVASSADADTMVVTISY